MTIYAATCTTATAEVVDKLRLDAAEDASRVSDWLQQTLLNVAMVTRYFAGSATGAALAAGATSQALDSTLIDVEYITCAFGGQTVEMQPATFDKILQLRSAGGTAASGPPYYYCLRKNTVEFAPNAAGGEVLTYYGATFPIVWTGSAVSGLPEPFGSKLLIYGACVEAADFKNDARLYTYYQGAYQAWLGSFLAFLNRRGTEQGRSWPIHGPNGRPFGHVWRPHDVSTDLFGVA